MESARIVRSAALAALLLMTMHTVTGEGSQAFAATVDEERKEVAALIERGNEAHARGAEREALVWYARAHSRSGAPDVLYRMAGLYASLGNHERAAAYLTRYLQEVPDNPYRDRIVSYRDAQKARAVKVQAKLIVESVPPGAAVVLDGVREPGVTPMTVPVTTGTVRLLVRAKDGREHTETLSISEKTTTRRRVLFDRGAVQPRPKPKPKTEPKPKPKPRPRPRPKPRAPFPEASPEYTLTRVSLAPPVALNALAWGGLTLAPIFAFTGYAMSQIGDPGLSAIFYILAGVGGLGGGYVLFVRDWSDGRFPRAGDRPTQKTAPAYGPGLRIEF